MLRYEPRRRYVSKIIMGFDILLVGIILLVNPFHTVTDLFAAVILAVAAKRGEGMLRDFKKVRLFSYGLIIIGALELFSFHIFSAPILAQISRIWRYGLIVPIEIYLLSGIMDFAMINENAEIYKRAQDLKIPVYVCSAISASFTAISGFISQASIVPFFAGLAMSVVSAMLAVIIFRCFKDSTAKKDHSANDENT